MRADQYLMLGVVGLGLYALYRISRAPSESEPLAERTKPLEQSPKGTSLALPESPGLIGPMPGVVFASGANPNMLAATISLENSRAYRGRGEGATLDTLARLGLQAGRVYETAGEARQAGFPEGALASPGKRTRWFYGRYLGPAMRIARPSEVQALWLTTGPAARMSGLNGGHHPYAARWYS